jgi:hypothetical protein
MTEPSDDRYPDDEHLRRYLLGDLSEHEEAAVETAYFTNPDLLAKVELAEHDLLDEYATDRMPHADRRKLERTILATGDGQMELALARALRSARHVEAGRAASRRPAARASRMYWLAAAATVALAVGGLSMVWLLRGDEERPSQPTVARTDTPSVSTAPPSPAVPPIVAATLVLTRDLSRSEGRPPTLIASPEITHVDLTVPDVRPGDVPVRIETVEGKEVWSGPIESATDGRSRVRVPAPVLGVGDYVLIIGGRGDPPSGGAPAYYFRVRSR